MPVVRVEQRQLVAADGKDCRRCPVEHGLQKIVPSGKLRLLRQVTDSDFLAELHLGSLALAPLGASDDPHQRGLPAAVLGDERYFLPLVHL